MHIAPSFTSTVVLVSSSFSASMPQYLNTLRMSRPGHYRCPRIYGHSLTLLYPISFNTMPSSTDAATENKSRGFIIFRLGPSAILEEGDAARAYVMNALKEMQGIMDQRTHNTLQVSCDRLRLRRLRIKEGFLVRIKQWKKVVKYRNLAIDLKQTTVISSEFAESKFMWKNKPGFYSQGSDPQSSKSDCESASAAAVAPTPSDTTQPTAAAAAGTGDRAADQLQDKDKVLKSTEYALVAMVEGLGSADASSIFSEASSIFPEPPSILSEYEMRVLREDGDITGLDADNDSPFVDPAYDIPFST
ncbi:hypothetical protein DAEQUDRAFT_723843 [Daedalea quercina L-15889]|uniref:Uncharacterized protein n=1 Tax=Daedalea quercina L-15889 TaxID=1314783 RepID=A0A165SB40_9APHY|nr:hypothetical protein DAEQUDRAFT_723843 [Daedalea quercina L-15889]